MKISFKYFFMVCSLVIFSMGVAHGLPQHAPNTYQFQTNEDRSTNNENSSVSSDFSSNRDRLENLLRRFEARRAERIAQAAKYNYALPSSNGNPSLNKYTQQLDSRMYEENKTIQKTNSPLVTVIPETNSANQITQSMENVIQLESTSSNTTLFSEALNKISALKIQRLKEAEKLQVLLPSQGGGMEHVSKSLTELNSTLRSIMFRLPTGDSSQSIN